MQLKPQRRANVKLYTTGLSADERALTGVEIIESVDAAIEDSDLNLEDFEARVNADMVGKVVNIASRCAAISTLELEPAIWNTMPMDCGSFCADGAGAAKVWASDM